MCLTFFVFVTNLYTCDTVCYMFAALLFQTGAHPESGTGSSGAGREPEARRTPGSQQGSNVGAAPEAGTRPEYDVTSGKLGG